MLSTWYGLWDFKDLKRRTFSDKVLRDKAFINAKNPKYDGYQKGLATMVYEFFDKNSKGSGVVNNEIKQNLQLAKELYKATIRNFKKRTVYCDFKYLLGAIDLYSKYAWVIPIKIKKGVSIVDAFQIIILQGRKPNKIWVDKGIEF